MGWVINATSAARFTPGNEPGSHCIGSWVEPQPVWTCGEYLASTGIQSADRPTRIECVYQVCYVGP